MITKDEILNLENTLYGAIKNSDTKVLDNLLHADLLFIIPSAQTITKEMDLQTYSEENLKVEELIPKVEELNIIDDLAVITLQMELKGNYNNEPFEAKYKYTGRHRCSVGCGRSRPNGDSWGMAQGRVKSHLYR